MSVAKTHPTVREYEEFYSDSCINILSRHLRNEVNRRGADVYDTRVQWDKYLSLRSESIGYLKSIGEWKDTIPMETKRTEDFLTEIIDNY